MYHLIPRQRHRNVPCWLSITRLPVRALVRWLVTHDRTEHTQNRTHTEEERESGAPGSDERLENKTRSIDRWIDAWRHDGRWCSVCRPERTHAAPRASCHHVINFIN